MCRGIYIAKHVFLGYLQSTLLCCLRVLTDIRKFTIILTDHASSCSAQAFRIIDQHQLPMKEFRRTPWRWDNFKSRFMSNTTLGATMPVVTAEVSSVPCKAHGCCNMLLSFRPATADVWVFDQVCAHSEWSTHGNILIHAPTPADICEAHV